ncbi:MAG: DUF115 domain-containing protein [Spirochaetaceae bacterium]|jgi:hypothetical protein|nr:DUF115 domain-containing protein [Spirochaetaceae bacterium]
MAKPGVYEKNMRALRRFFPGLERIISGAEDESGLVVEMAASGVPTARLNGVYLHSARDPVREAQRLVARGGAGAELVVLLGFGLGYAVEAALALSPQPALVVIEKSPGILRAALQCRDLSGFFDKRLVFVLNDDPAPVISAFRVAPEKTALIRNPALTAADGEFYREVEHHIENWRTKDMVNEATLRRFGKRWVKNQAANLRAIRDLPGVELLSGLFDFPVLLVAAGPSLDRITGKLKALVGRCIVVAVDTALRFLEKEGVRPDFAVSVDPQFWNFRHLDRCLSSKTILITESAVYPGVLRERRGGGAAFLCGSLYPLGSFIEARASGKGRLGAGGSVASTAWDFAALLVRNAAAPAIFIAGLDLAFPGFATHYKGAFFEENAHVTANRFLPAETKSFHAQRGGAPFFAKSADGNPVLTDKRLSLYASWFENRLKSAKNYHNSRLSGDGLAINGLETICIDDILALPICRPAIEDRIERVMSGIFEKWNDEDARKTRAERYEAAYSALVTGLEEALSAARSVLRCISAFRRSGGGGIYDGELLQRIEAANAVLFQSEVKAVAGFLLPTAAEPPPHDMDGFISLTAKTYGDFAESLAFTLSALSDAGRLLDA